MNGLSRRAVLRGTAAVTGAAAVTTVGAGTAQAAPTPEETAALRRPSALREGDRVRIVSPGRAPDERLDRGIEILRGFGLEVEVATHARDRYGYLAGTDADRLADLNEAFADPGVRGVFGARGGYGSQRIVDGLDLKAVRRDPKVFVGFSDLAAVHGRLYRGAKLATVYGPLMNWADARTGPDSVESLRRAVMTTDPVVLTRDPAEPSAAVEVPGTATGVLLGGTLTMLDTGVHTNSVPNLDGAILLIEDVDEAPYSYDRMLTHLRRAGALDHLAGVAVGQLVNAAPTPGEWTAAEAVQDRLADLGVPVLGGLRIGHGTGQLSVPLGVPATIDTTAGTLTVQAAVRA